jgi:squalene-hopene/tetraprenyl-beta-curcumene cyclase
LQASTAEETSWAIMALARFPRNGALAAAIERGVRWLIAHQHPDGAWQAASIGLYFSAMWYRDSYYAVSLPLQALARARAWYART